MRIQTFDTTLRDGTQGESVSFSVDDKLAIAQKLDEIGIDYIEGGWPGSNPKDKGFFERAKSELKLRHAKLTAFGSTRLARNPVAEDPNVRELLAAATPVISIFGKSWDFHTQYALGITEEQNLDLIGSTVAHLVAHGREVVYDAEHFFDGYIANRDFALRTLEAAKRAGASVLCLCDTNGGTLPNRLAEIVADVRRRFDGVIGIHPHNDSDVAVANALAAVEAGATHVQGTVNGYGERCGNANLVSIIASLELKMGHETIGRERLANLSDLARYIADRANLQLRNDQPFVGKSAFAHKGGVHVSAVMKNAAMYEHIQPELIGNSQRVLLSDLSGRSNVQYKLDRYNMAEGLDEAARKRLLQTIKEKENEGYDFEVAEGNFELLVLNERHGSVDDVLQLAGFDVTTKVYGEDHSMAVGSVILSIKGRLVAATEMGHGPFDALHNAFVKCLRDDYPSVAKLELLDYKVRVLGGTKGTASQVRVLVEWTDGKRNWSTVGISDDVIQASVEAMFRAIQLELQRARQDQLQEAYGWGV